MAATPVAFATIDKAAAPAQLNATISPSATSIALQSGHGAKFPQPYSSTTTSGGTSVTLNCTGISATVGGNAVLGKIIWNKTDGSVGVITAVATNAITTTRLLGGTDNTWDSGDTWCIDPFVVTFVTISTSAYGVQSDSAFEEALITGRSTDTLTVATSGRGYNSTTAQQFSSGDYVYLRVTSPILERLKDVIAVIATQVNTNVTSINAILDQSSFYVAAAGSSSAYTASYANVSGPLAAGMRFTFLANHACTGASTLTVTLAGSAQSAKAIKKLDGATALASGDIANGQLVQVEYDGTNFQMFSQIGNAPAAQTVYEKVVYMGATTSTTLTNPTSDTAFDTHTYSVPANDITATVGYEFEVGYTITWGTSGAVEVLVGFGSTRLGGIIVTSSGSNAGVLRGVLMGTAAAGASVPVRGTASGGIGALGSGSYNAVNFATNGGLTLDFLAKFGTSNGSNVIALTMCKITKFSTTPF